MAQMINNLPAMQEAWFWSLGREDPLEEEMATHCSVLAWRIPWTEEPGRLWSMGSQRVRQDWTTNLSLSPWNPSMCMRSPIFVKPWTPTLTPKLNWEVRSQPLMHGWRFSSNLEGKSPSRHPVLPSLFLSRNPLWGCSHPSLVSSPPSTEASYLSPTPFCHMIMLLQLYSEPWNQ